MYEILVYTWCRPLLQQMWYTNNNTGEKTKYLSVHATYFAHREYETLFHNFEMHWSLWGVLYLGQVRLVAIKF